MQFSTILVALTTAAITLASPIEVVPRTGGTQSGCSNNQELKCCQGIANNELEQLALGILLPINAGVPVAVGCVPISVLGCNNQAACCSGNTQQVGLINVDLDCIQV